MGRSRYSPAQKELQECLRQARIHAGLRQVDLASRLGKPQSFVSKYESGERLLDLLEIRQVCSALGVPLTEFVQKFEDQIK
jgi:transcriptional regulator with XRE-family HTH domain